LLGGINERRAGCAPQAFWGKPDGVMRAGADAVAAACATGKEFSLVDGPGRSQDRKYRSWSLWLSLHRLGLDPSQKAAGDQGAAAERLRVVGRYGCDPANDGGEPTHDAIFG
jgi:hypothetical protein